MSGPVHPFVGPGSTCLRDDCTKEALAYGPFCLAHDGTQKAPPAPRCQAPLRCYGPCCLDALVRSERTPKPTAAPVVIPPVVRDELAAIRSRREAGFTPQQRRLMALRERNSR